MCGYATSVLIMFMYDSVRSCISMHDYVGLCVWYSVSIRYLNRGCVHALFSLLPFLFLCFFLSFSDLVQETGILHFIS